MTKRWILVANGSLARLFSRTGPSDPLLTLETIDFPEGRLKGTAFERDRQGHERSDNSTAATHFEPRTSTHKKLLHEFARVLAARLESGLVKNEYDALWIIVSSPFLGEFKTALSPAVTSRLQWTYEADLTGLDMRSLESRLRELRMPT